jgi:hypothetical protein
MGKAKNSDSSHMTRIPPVESVGKPRKNTSVSRDRSDLAALATSVLQDPPDLLGWTAKTESRVDRERWEPSAETPLPTTSLDIPIPNNALAKLLPDLLAEEDPVALQEPQETTDPLGATADLATPEDRDPKAPLDVPDLLAKLADLELLGL